MEKYTLVTIGGIHTQIALKTKVKGYTEGILEIFFPEDEEMEKWDEKKVDKWIDDNNKRMEAICDLLNNNSL